MFQESLLVREGTSTDYFVRPSVRLMLLGARHVQQTRVIVKNVLSIYKFHLFKYMFTFGHFQIKIFQNHNSSSSAPLDQRVFQLSAPVHPLPIFYFP